MSKKCNRSELGSGFSLSASRYSNPTSLILIISTFPVQNWTKVGYRDETPMTQNATEYDTPSHCVA